MRILKPLPGILPMPGHLLTDAVGLWPMNSLGNKVFDLSGRNNTGTLTGTAPSWVSGKYGSAIDFPGTDEDIVLANTILFTYPGTIIFSYKPDAGSIFMGLNSDTNNFLRNSSPISLDFRNNTGGDRSVAIPDMTIDWQTFAIVAARPGSVSNLEVYRNGLYLTTWSLDPTLYINCIGHGYTGTLLQYNGKFSHVMILNCALSASEIALLYREPFCMSPEPIMPEFGIAV